MYKESKRIHTTISCLCKITFVYLLSFIVYSESVITSNRVLFSWQDDHLSGNMHELASAFTVFHSVCLSVCLLPRLVYVICKPVFLSACLPFSLSLCLSVCMYVCLSGLFYLSDCLRVCQAYLSVFLCVMCVCLHVSLYDLMVVCIGLTFFYVYSTEENRVVHLWAFVHMRKLVILSL
jgi:hypothetical protein